MADGELLNQCNEKARHAFRRSLVWTWVSVIACVISCFDWYDVANTSRFNDNAERISFAVKSAIAITLLLIASYRLGKYATFHRFIETMARRKPGTFYELVKRSRDEEVERTSAVRREQTEFQKSQDAEFRERVTQALKE